MVMAMGGRAAELVVFGPSEITQGASSDLEMVSRIAREMVTRYGFSPIGPLSLEGEGSEVFLGRDWLRSEPHHSQKTSNRIDAEVQRLARHALDQAVSLLEPRRDLMDELVNLLIERETIEGPDFRAVVDRASDLGKADVEAAQVGL